MTKEELKTLKMISNRFDDLAPCKNKAPSSDFVSSFILNNSMPNGDIDYERIKNEMYSCKNCGVQSCPITQLRDFVETVEWEMSLETKKNN